MQQYPQPKATEEFELSEIPITVSTTKVIERLQDEGIKVKSVIDHTSILTIEAETGDPLLDFVTKPYFRIGGGHKVTITRSIRRKDQKKTKVDPSKMIAEINAPITPTDAILIQFTEIDHTLRDYKLISNDFYKTFPYWNPWVRYFASDNTAVVQIPFARLLEYQDNFFNVTPKTFCKDNQTVLNFKMYPWRIMVIELGDILQFNYLKEKDTILETLSGYNFDIKDGPNGQLFLQIKCLSIADKSMIDLYHKVKQIVNSLVITEVDAKGSAAFLDEYYSKFLANEKLVMRFTMNNKTKISKIVICGLGSAMSSGESLLRGAINKIVTHRIGFPKDFENRRQKAIEQFKNNVSNLPLAISIDEKSIIIGSSSHMVEVASLILQEELGIFGSNFSYIFMNNVQYALYSEEILPKLTIPAQITVSSINPILIKGSEKSRLKVYHEINDKVKHVFYRRLLIPKIVAPLLTSHLQSLFFDTPIKFAVSYLKDNKKQNGSQNMETQTLGVVDLALEFENELEIEFRYISVDIRAKIQERLSSLKIHQFSSKTKGQILQSYIGPHITHLDSIEIDNTNGHITNTTTFFSFCSLEILKYVESCDLKNELITKQIYPTSISQKQKLIFNSHKRTYELSFVKRFQPNNNSCITFDNFTITAPWKKILEASSFYTSLELNDTSLATCKILDFAESLKQLSGIDFSNVVVNLKDTFKNFDICFVGDDNFSLPDDQRGILEIFGSSQMKLLINSLKYQLELLISIPNITKEKLSLSKFKQVFLSELWHKINHSKLMNNSDVTEAIYKCSEPNLYPKILLPEIMDCMKSFAPSNEIQTVDLRVGKNLTDLFYSPTVQKFISILQQSPFSQTIFLSTHQQTSVITSFIESDKTSSTLPLSSVFKSIEAKFKTRQLFVDDNVIHLLQKEGFDLKTRIQTESNCQIRIPSLDKTTVFGNIISEYVFDNGHCLRIVEYDSLETITNVFNFTDLDDYNGKIWNMILESKVETDFNIDVKNVLKSPKPILLFLMQKLNELSSKKNINVNIVSTNVSKLILWHRFLEEISNNTSFQRCSYVSQFPICVEKKFWFWKDCECFIAFDIEQNLQLSEVFTTLTQNTTSNTFHLLGESDLDFVLTQEEKTITLVSESRKRQVVAITLSSEIKQWEYWNQINGKWREFDDFTNSCINCIDQHSKKGQLKKSNLRINFQGLTTIVEIDLGFMKNTDAQTSKTETLAITSTHKRTHTDKQSITLIGFTENINLAEEILNREIDFATKEIVLQISSFENLHRDLDKIEKICYRYSTKVILKELDGILILKGVEFLPFSAKCEIEDVLKHVLK